MRVLLVVAAVLAVEPATVWAQDSSFVWRNATELSFVSTGGNASASTLGLKAVLTGTGGLNSAKLEVGGIRGETSFTTRTATGSIDSPVITETTKSQLTAENYFARARYDRALASAFVFFGAGWHRNTFAGIQNRYSSVAGLGKTLIDGESGRFKADAGATYTVQRDVDPAPGADDGYLGSRVTVDATRRVSASAAMASLMVFDERVEESGDYRFDWINSLKMALSEKLAFQTSLQLLFDNQPLLLPVALLDLSGEATGTKILTPGDKLDSILTLTLVIKL